MENIINRKYKDRLFCSIFKEKKELLSLYNAINGTAYTDESALQICTLDNAIYMTMKNDLSFFIYGIVNLYEHQSTWNPNMPLRDFLYIAKQITKLIEKDKKDLFGKRLVTIPTPEAIVFYNGTRKQPEKQILRLSDSFENKSIKGCLEFECTVLNINYGKNKELMNKCKSLMDYAILIDKIREYNNTEDNLEYAVERAIQECIDENVLADFLRLNLSEVKELILSEYDEQRHIANERRWSWEDAVEAVNKLNRILLSENRLDELEKAINDKEYQRQLLDKYNLIDEDY